MNSIIFNKATIEDVNILVDCRIAFALELAGERDEILISKLKKQMTDYFLKATVNNECISIIARCGGEVAGIGSVHIREMPGNFKNPSGKWGYIMNMYTIPAYRRRGVCKGILSALVDEGTKMGINAFELHATPEGELVYKQEGFELYGEPTYRKWIRNEN